MTPIAGDVRECHRVARSELADRSGSTLLFALALLTKAIAVTLPLALLAYFILARPWRFPWLFLLGLLGLAAAATLYRLLLLPPWVFGTAHQPGITPWIYFITEWSAYLYYLRLFLWPDALVIDRVDYPYAYSLLDFQAWGSLLVLVGIAVGAWWARRRVPVLTFAALWYFIALAAESTFFPLAEPVNEHRPYLAMLGLGTASGYVLWEGARRVADRLGAPRGWLFAVVVAVATCLLGAAAFARNETWRDEYSLWSDAIAKAPLNGRAWLNAGHASLVRGNLAEASARLLEAHRLTPCYAFVQMNLSALAAREGNLHESLRWADEAVGCDPTSARTHYFRGLALERLGDGGPALEAYVRATAEDPAYADAWLAQARLLEDQRLWTASAQGYDRALAVNPTDIDAAMHAGLLYQYRLGESTRAVERFRAVLHQMPTHYGARYQLAVALLASGDRAGAVRTWDDFLPSAKAIDDHASIDGAPEALRQHAH